MPEAEWGVKRTCPHCETRFYDLQKEPIVCPECGTTYDVDAHGKVSATRERRAVAPAGADEKDLVDEEDGVDGDDAGGDKALLDDEEDEDDEPASPALSDEHTDEDEEKAFKDPDLADDEKDEDEDELDDDDDGELGLDDLPDTDKH